MKQSFRSAPAIIWTWLTWYLTGIPNLRVTPDSLLQFIISKGSHIFFFGTEAILIYFALPRNSQFKTLYSIILASAFGAATELHQHFIPGRHMDIRDWALDTLSALAFLFILKKLQSKV